MSLVERDGDHELGVGVDGLQGNNDGALEAVRLGDFVAEVAIEELAVGGPHDGRVHTVGEDVGLEGGVGFVVGTFVELRGAGCYSHVSLRPVFWTWL